MKSNFITILEYRFSIILICTLSVFAAGCSLTQDTDFPAISYSKTESAAVSEGLSEDDSGISSGTLKMALPFSSVCIRYLTYLYVGERAGLFKNSHASENGLTIPLEALDIYDVGLRAVLQITGSRGLTTEDIQMLDAANNLPDIFLMHDQRAFDSGDIVPADLNSPRTDQYITPGNVYPTFIFDTVSEDSLLTIPLYASTKMIYANRSLFDSSDIKDSSMLRSPLSIKTVQTLSKQITSPEEGIYGFMGFSELLAYLPSAASPFPQSYMWNNGTFDFRNQAFADSVTLLSGFAAEQSSVDSLNEAQRQTLYGTSDPRTINKIAFWIDDSDSLSE